MKILIGYDGSACSDAALDDLKTAGLPETDDEVFVVSIAEVWSPSPPAKIETSINRRANSQTNSRQTSETHSAHSKNIAEYETYAKHAASRLQKMFPAWRVKAEANYGSPAREIIKKADRLKADLIVVGSHGRSALGRFFLGSVSQKILSEASCSVRIARGRVEVDPIPPQRVIIGYDGSAGANAAIASIAARRWREMSDFKIVVATDSLVPLEIGRFVPPAIVWTEGEMKAASLRLEKLAAPALKILRNAGLSATLEIFAGNPKEVLAEEATRRHADAIFLGAVAHGSRLERFTLGSISAAVAARASCSVEVVRRKP